MTWPNYTYLHEMILKSTFYNNQFSLFKFQWWPSTLLVHLDSLPTTKSKLKDLKHSFSYFVPKAIEWNYYDLWTNFALLRHYWSLIAQCQAFHHHIHKPILIMDHISIWRRKNLTHFWASIDIVPNYPVIHCK